MDLVSIIVPNFNSSQYIAATIESILNQSFSNFELIIVDDCSTDECCKIISQYAERDSRVRLRVLDKNNGRPAIPRNVGISMASGNYLAFMDSDDIWHRQKLELQLEAMRQQEIYFSGTALTNFVNDAKIAADVNRNIDRVTSEKITHNKLIKKNIMPNSSIMISKDVLGELRFNEDPKYKAIEDFHLWLRVLQNYEFALKINEELLFYRLADTSISKSKFGMFKKNYMLYNDYRIGDKRLGLKKYLYLVSYIYYSIVRISKGKL